jgi:hypothetical protein
LSRFDAAVHFYGLAIRESPSESAYYNNRGMVFRKMAQREKALVGCSLPSVSSLRASSFAGSQSLAFQMGLGGLQFCDSAQHHQPIPALQSSDALQR